jgi:hypothetical protein
MVHSDLVGDVVGKGLRVTSIFALIGGGRLCFGGHLGKILKNNSVRKNCSSREKLLKLEAEGREFTKNLRSIDKFIRNRMLF